MKFFYQVWWFFFILFTFFTTFALVFLPSWAWVIIFVVSFFAWTQVPYLVEKQEKKK